MPAKQATNWVITDNKGDVAKWQALTHENVRYMAFQLERGTHDHIQGFIQLSQKKTATWVKNFVGDNAHVEVAKKTKCDDACAEAMAEYEAGKDATKSPCARHYCMKAYTRVEGPFEKGDFCGQGERSDLLKVKDMLDRGASIKEVYQEDFETSAKHHRFFKEYRQMVVKDRRWPMKIFIFFGPTGCGKTRRAYEMDQRPFSVSTDKTYPFSHYDGEETVLWDEFSGSCCDIKYLLRLMDQYPMKVRGLHCEVEFTSRTLIITSNLAPWDWYPGAHQEHVAALKRRIEEFGKIFTTNGPNEWMDVAWPSPVVP